MTLPARVGALLFSRPRLAALALGGISACGFEPLHLWPLTLGALVLLLVLAERAASPRQVALLGWLFGLAHFTIGNTWIATAFTYQAAMPVWLGGIAVVGLAAYLAVYPMLALLAARLIARGGGGALVLAFAATWIVTEWMRAWVFTGFVWNPLGIVLLGGFDSPGWAWMSKGVGTYGLSGLAVLVAGALRHWRVFGRVPVLAGGAVLAAGMVWPGAQPAEGPVAYSLVQPDIRQEVLNDPAHYEANFVRTAKLSQPGTRGDKRLVLWPESGVPDYLEDGYPDWVYRGNTYASDPAIARERIGRVIGPGALLLTGAVDLEIEDGEPVAARNVVTALDDTGAIRGSYAKAHLVPYGEYLPLRWLLEPLGLSRLVPGALDFWPGPGPRTMVLGDWGRAGIQICYEIVFSGEVVDRANRPDYIFNPSNDGWFGAWGPPQHLAQARLRAIEEGLPVLRATTTGISAVIGPNGVVAAHIPRHVARRIDGRVPLAEAPTPFARWGNMLPLVLAAGLLVLSLVAIRRKRG